MLAMYEIKHPLLLITAVHIVKINDYRGSLSLRLMITAVHIVKINDYRGAYR